MNLEIVGCSAQDILNQLLAKNANEALWNQYIIAKIIHQDNEMISLKVHKTFTSSEDYWNYKKIFSYPFLSIGTLKDHLHIEVRTGDEFISACLDKERLNYQCCNYTSIFYYTHELTDIDMVAYDDAKIFPIRAPRA